MRQPLKPVGAVLKRTRTTLATIQSQALEQLVEVRDEDAMAVDEQLAVIWLTRKLNRAWVHHVAFKYSSKMMMWRQLGCSRSGVRCPVSEAQMFEEHVNLVADSKAFMNAEPETDPDSHGWGGTLDAKDADDPLMVSEYVVEIFKCMKEVEVRFKSFIPFII